IVSAREYQANLETQSFRTVRIPAVRGKILDRTGTVLAENRPTFNASLYLEELRKPFDTAYFQKVLNRRAEIKRRVEAEEKRLNRKLNKLERRNTNFALPLNEKNSLRQQARYEVASNVVLQVSQRLQKPLALDAVQFERHYDTRLALPYPVLENLDNIDVARFEEQAISPMGIDLEVQSTRFYPYQTTAAHLLGSLRRDDSSMEGEEAFFSFRLPDYRGSVGIEFGYDKELRGQAGAKSVLVNNMGYRHTENIWSPAEPGQNVVLTIDLRLQQAAERALQGAKSGYGPTPRGAVVVMDVQTGDILAMASAPSYNPNHYIHGFPPGEHQRMSELFAEKNRATQENYAPGSIFKTIVGLACLDAGLNPKESFTVEENPAQPGKGHIRVGNRSIRDTAAPGAYDFRRALKRSSNSYFINYGLRYGPERIVRLAQKVHFGERTGLPTRQEVGGYIPSVQRLSTDWTDGNTANLSIGQAPVLVTPLQITVLTSAIANGGKVLWPRLVDRIEPQDPTSEEPPVAFPKGRVRDQLGVKPRSLALLHEAMLADTEDPDGTGRDAVGPGMRICGKTGTAQVQNERNKKTGQTTWFASFAPYEKPRYAVVVMVENGISGGETCAPIAGKIYAALLERERQASVPSVAGTSSTSSSISPN
ncbi:MAG TPA: penicillin-binding transpeptidase domain-containing protein, partial [Candidatus Sulfotelmatobacter sp.]|nr:penicillin-binding transpeptidase domain-containing protein [Candidatus Sulfotelmatobacter sp.]